MVISVVLRDDDSDYVIFLSTVAMRPGYSCCAGAMDETGPKPGAMKFCIWSDGATEETGLLSSHTPCC